MSVSPSLPPGHRSVAELLLERAFSRPPKPLLDADVILALGEAGQDRAVVADPSPAPGAPHVDVRA
jgi:hypothetical protein